MSAAILVANFIFVNFYQIRSLLTQWKHFGYQPQNSVVNLRSAYNEFSKKLLTQLPRLYLFTEPDLIREPLKNVFDEVYRVLHTVLLPMSALRLSVFSWCVVCGGGGGSDEGSARVRCGASSSSACPWPHSSLRQNCIDKYLDTNPNVKRYTNLSSRKWFTFVSREQPT